MERPPLFEWGLRFYKIRMLISLVSALDREPPPIIPYIYLSMSDNPPGGCMIREKETKHSYSPKIKFFEIYGRVCACCGESNPLFLTLDHVNNDGNVKRNKRNNESEYRKAVAEYRPDIYQVLCFNCNCGKNRNNGICPHKEIRTLEWEETTLKKCAECGILFGVAVKYAAQSTYCSYNCRNKSKAKRHKEKQHLESKLKNANLIPVVRLCPHCNKYFLVDDIYSVRKAYCSVKCGERAKEARKRAKRREISRKDS